MLHSLVKPLRNILTLFSRPAAYLGPRTAEAVSLLNALAPGLIWARPNVMPPVEGGYGVIMLSPACRDERQVFPALQTAMTNLALQGAVVIAVRSDGSDPTALAHSLGLRLYTRHESTSSIGDSLLLFVRDEYSITVHARDLGMQRRHAEAARLIEETPQNWFRSTDEQWDACVEAQRQYLALCDLLGVGIADLALLGFAQKHFYTAIFRYPLRHEPYRLQAELWTRFGRTDMARRILRSVQHLVPETATVHQIEMLPDIAPDRRFESTPAWDSSKFKPRILILTHDNSDYGLDTLYDGLCQVLGTGNVVEFPWKPTLHGQRPESALNYPCVFDYPGEPHTPEQIRTELAAGRFDLILHADVVQNAYRDTVRSFLESSPDTPVVVYDTWDNPHNLLPSVLSYLNRGKVFLHFKREMVKGIEYGVNARPLPFGYPDRLVPAHTSTGRSRPLFWAGKRLYGMRPLYLEYLAPKYGFPMEPTFAQPEYIRAIDDSQIGLSFFGFGYDTVRYWELPAHGVMLLSERPPIHLPHDFVDGKSAVFFDDLAELEQKLEYQLAHPEETARIAARGREHFLRYHTSSARARQFLGYVQAALSDTNQCRMDA